MPQLPLNKYTYPPEDMEPHFDSIESFFKQLDVALWNLKIKSYFILAGGGAPTFDSGTGILEWTEDFVIKNAVSGFLVQIPYGNDLVNKQVNVQDGQVAYVSFPSKMTVNENRPMQSADKIDITDSFFVLGFRYGTKLYLQNGVIL